MSKISKSSWSSNLKEGYDVAYEGTYFHLELSVSGHAIASTEKAREVLQKAEKALSDLFNTPSDGST